MSCENCPNFEECREFALNLNRDSDYKELHPDMIREVERYIEKCREDCAEWESGGEEYYRNKLNEEIGKSLKWMRDIRTHIENVCSYQSEYLKNNIKVYCVENERRKMFVSELKRLDGSQQPFVLDRLLSENERAWAIFHFFEKEGYIKIREGKKFLWLKGNKTDFLCFVIESIDYLRYKGKRKSWALFEQSFEIDRSLKFKPNGLQSYSKKAEVQDAIENNEGECGAIKHFFSFKISEL